MRSRVSMLQVLLAYTILLILTIGTEGEKYQQAKLFARVLNGSLHDLTRRNTSPVLTDVNYVSGPFGDPAGAITNLGGQGVIEWPNNIDSPLSLDTEYTLIFWLKDGTVSFGCVICYMTGEYDQGLSILRHSAPGSLMLWQSDTSGETTVLPFDSVVNDTTWTLMAFSYNGTTGQLSVYRNSLLIYQEVHELSGYLATDRPVLRMLGTGYDGSLACIQLYGTYLSQREIVQLSSLCSPEHAALKPWPQPLGIWPLDEHFGTRDMALDENSNDATAFYSYLDSGPSNNKSSYVFRGDGVSFLEIDNADKSLNPQNSFTYSVWVYPTSLLSSDTLPLLVYEKGSGDVSSPRWNIWLIGSQVFLLTTTGSPVSSHGGSLKSHQWNFISMSYDYGKSTNRWVVNGEEAVGDVGVARPTWTTDSGNRIRVGRTFEDSDPSPTKARISCVQMYDISMSFDEMKSLATKCDDITKAEDGEPPGLHIMFPLDEQSRCSALSEFGQRFELTNMADCSLTAGPRGRDREAVRLTVSDVSGNFALITKMVESDVDFMQSDSSFTLMFYIRLDPQEEVSARIGFAESDTATSDTWMLVSTSGSIQWKAGGVDMSDNEVTTIDNVYNQSEVGWVHLAVSCYRVSGRCYLYRNRTLVGESVEDVGKDWFVSSSIFIEVLSSLPVAYAELSCLQLYSAPLSHGEIVSSFDRCRYQANRGRYPLPVAFWPADVTFLHREMTSRSSDLKLDDHSTFLTESPFFNNQGSLWPNGSQVTIEQTASINLHHSFTLQAYIKIRHTNHTNHTDHRTLSVFCSHSSTTSAHALCLSIRISNESACLLHHLRSSRAGSDNDSHACGLGYDAWHLIAVSYTYPHGDVTTYIDGLSVHASRVGKRRPIASADLAIGSSLDSALEISCIQLFDKALTARQLNAAAQRCRHNRKTGYHYMRPDSVPSGYTRLSVDSTVSARSQLDCLQTCSDNSDCLSVNYSPADQSCGMSSTLWRDRRDLSDYEHTGCVYLEKQHPLVAEAL